LCLGQQSFKLEDSGTSIAETFFQIVRAGSGLLKLIVGITELNASSF
jgi:hypothetical protein